MFLLNKNFTFYISYNFCKYFLFIQNDYKLHVKFEELNLIFSHIFNVFPIFNSCSMFATTNIITQYGSYPLSTSL